MDGKGPITVINPYLLTTIPPYIFSVFAQADGGGEKMSFKKDKPNTTPSETGKEKLKWETAKELGLDDDLAGGGDELTVREAGKIGGNMVKKLVEKGEQEIAKQEETYKEDTE